MSSSMLLMVCTDDLDAGWRACRAHHNHWSDMVLCSPEEAQGNDGQVSHDL